MVLSRRPSVLVLLLSSAFLAASGIALTGVVATGPAAAAEDPAGGSPAKYFVDVRLAAPEQARDLAAQGFDVAGVDREQPAAGVVATEAELARLRALGYVYVIREQQGPGPRALEATEALGQYTDPLEMMSFVNQVVATYPSLAEKVILEGTLFEGQKQIAVHITKDVSLPNLRPRFILDAQHHAREVMTSEIAKDVINYLTARYSTDTAVRRWVDNIDIWIVPMVNPDGIAYMFNTDSYWRRNRHPGCAVDLNRNYDFLWNACNGSSGSCSSDTFRGTAPASEPETRGLDTLTQNKRPFFTLSYHSYGEYLMYSYGCSDPDEKAALEAFAQELNAKLERDNGQKGGWKTGPIWSTIYEADGGSVDAQYGRHGAYGFVIEVNTGGFQPDYDTWRNPTITRQRVAWQHFLDKMLDGPQVRGRVTDAQTGAPLPAAVGFAEVTFTHGELPRHADDRGLFHLLAQANRTYTLQVSHPGYCTVARSVAVGTGPASADVALDHPAAPQGVSAAAGGANQVEVAWSSVAGAAEYHVYRALAPGGPWTLAGTAGGAATHFTDDGVSGGVTWYYTVRAFTVCESPDSNVASAATSGACTLPPGFAGLGAARDGEQATCTVALDWAAATSYCGGPLTYRVYRSATAPFTPSPATLVAAGLGGTHFDDHAALASGTPQHYIVRAADAVSGQEDANTVTFTATPTGPRAPGTWADDAGDTGTAALSGDAPWSVQTTGGKTAPRVYATGSYADNLCAALATPAIRLQAGARLTFASKYDIETNYDAGVVEVATAPSFTNWTKLATVNYPDALSNGGNACGIATGGAGTAFSRSGTPAYAATDYAGSLAAYAGQDVRLRFRFGTDGGSTGQGWWIDDVRVENALVPTSCSAGVPPTPKEVAAPAPLTCVARAGAIDVAFAPACGALDTAAFWGRGPIAGAPVWAGAACGLGTTGRASFDPGPVAPGGLVYFVLVGQRGAVEGSVVEGSYGRASTGAERPEAAGLGSCEAAQDLGGTCP